MQEHFRMEIPAWRAKPGLPNNYRVPMIKKQSEATLNKADTGWVLKQNKQKPYAELVLANITSGEKWLPTSPIVKVITDGHAC